ncbi:iron donor protein CyaY [Neptunomonas phycophila]|mgnify:CR=1 FL=1|jgi:CyaY protein|uniref:Iron-sulfur cluster assembly protein CyaY n=1 Tax=Neptunomonas phycophila TaxID=1572645 RepID=A0AAW7XKY5_9GAMM|nr:MULTISPECIES: iron donor protein CyaY [Neptunomonas]MDN2660788.1 iron donor protein CyaY [Neptunomonas sp. CHC150]MDO6453729.1 iron donor protein CyaY [Neptunomonas phycophila]MDO6784006.1 iron donor protein CyaY [Neptunomonas phycophila]MDP2523375.1 iron donor protein CyaY [Neptunomonas phycophila]
MMTESEFYALVDETLISVEEKLDDAETDLDYLISGGVLTIKCENKSQIIFTRQTPVRQLWLATKTGGFHFDYDAELKTWVRDSDKATIRSVFEAAFLDQAGESLSFDI